MDGLLQTNLLFPSRVLTNLNVTFLSEKWSSKCGMNLWKKRSATRTVEIIPFISPTKAKIQNMTSTVSWGSSVVKMDKRSPMGMKTMALKSLKGGKIIKLI